MLIYHKDPNGLTEKEIYQLDTSLSLLQNIRNKFPKGFDNNITDVYLNNEKKIRLIMIYPEKRVFLIKLSLLIVSKRRSLLA